MQWKYQPANPASQPGRNSETPKKLSIQINHYENDGPPCSIKSHK